ncbi:MAG TPA: hypothetical protein H9881_17125 [Candidatus Stackebrandtia excrementipullorum]|nr:hypothetical protein [Candidatus Stackebrandtia excrementipullorum]
MTHAVPQFETPGPKKRPGSVTFAAGLQFLVFALGVATAVFSLVYGPDMTEAMRASLESQGAAPDVVESVSGGDDALTVTLSLLPSVVMLVLAFFVLRGANGARITTWVFSGLMLLCSLAGIGILGLLGGFQAEGIDFGAVTEAGVDAVPGWYNLFTTVGGIVMVLAYLLIIILLALPASNEYFRKDRGNPQVVLPGDQG